MKRTVLDLCAGTGAWSQPYVDAGYEVYRITLPQDVRLLTALDEPIHGVLAAPPCTMFCRMRMCRGRPTDAQFQEALSVVDACLRMVAIYRPQWWALENPQGYLKQWLGEPQLKFHPWEYGDPWTKRTWLWGQFTPPKRNPVEPQGAWVRKHEKGTKRQPGMAKNARERSLTPPNFAQAFFDANP